MKIYFYAICFALFFFLLSDISSSQNCDSYSGYYCVLDADGNEAIQLYSCESGTECGVQCICNRIEGRWKYCHDYNSCNGSCPNCYYKTHYCHGSSTGCEDWKQICCDMNTPGANCDSYDLHDPDENQSYCINCSQSWNIGGEVSGTVCCGDDYGEYARTRQCSSGCTSNSNDDACCDSSTDCVYNSVCYSSGWTGCAPWNSNAIAQCSSGWWSQTEDCSTKPSVDSDGGDVPRTAGTCTDYTTCSAGSCSYTNYADVCVSGTQLTEYYNSGASCLSKTYTCSDFEVSASDTDGGDNPSSNGQCIVGTAAGCSSNAFSTSSGTGGGSDTCVGTCGTGTNSCVYREYYPIDSSDACPGLDSCTSKDYDADTNANTCKTCLGDGKWNISYIPNCCGDDANEYVRTRECDGYACTSDPNDNACCDQTTDCVWNDVCYNNGAPHPTQQGATCVNGVWRDTTAPRTTINPNGGDFTGQNVTSFTLTCSDTGGSGCDKTYYKIINDGEACGTTGFTDGTSGMVTCPFGQICEKRVCFYSVDKAGNKEAVNVSEIFHLETNACQGRVCGESCLYAPGVCNATNGNCYANGGCLLNCSVPSLGPGQQRIWFKQNCGRSNATKCDVEHVCANSITSGYCTTGGASTRITGNWDSYTPASGYYGVGQTFHIIISNVASNPSAFSILTECEVAKANGNVIYFNSWGNGNIDFNYTISSSDPEGEWNITYCGLWSDFIVNGGWQIKFNNTLYHFYIDKTPPSITIHSPVNGGKYKNNILVNASITDALSGVNSAFFRWENASENGGWTPLTRNGNYYTASFDISSLADGYYNLTIKANDSVGNENQAKVFNFLIDRQAPQITIISPVSKWYNTNFEVKARVTDNQGVSSVLYRWENSSNIGPWVPMSLGADGNYSATFSITSVASGNYTIRVWANDTLGNSENKTVNIGIDYVAPTSVMTQPMPPGSFVFTTKFNISWTGSDSHSGVNCYQAIFSYCDMNTKICSDVNYTINFGGSQCTSQTLYEFDISKDAYWISDPNNYTFFFKTLAVDNAGNTEIKTLWDTNVTIYIPKLITYNTIENKINRVIRNGGKVANNKTVIINVKAKPDVEGLLNITIYYANHTLGYAPSQWFSISCENTRECNASITLFVDEEEGIKEVDYYIYAENKTLGSEYLPPNAPSGYFFYLVYHHPICNFLAKDVLKTILGSSDIVPIQVRNIKDVNDDVTLTLISSPVSNLAKFVETNLNELKIILLPQEEKIVYARLVGTANDFTLTLQGVSNKDGTQDTDSLKIIVSLPPDFSELNNFSIFILAILATLIYLAFVKKDD